MKITFNNATKAISTITEKCKNTRGDMALAVYFLKHDTKEAFAPHTDKMEDYRKSLEDMQNKYQKLKDGKSKKKKQEKIDQEFQKIKQEMEKLAKEEEEVKLTKGKINIKDLEEQGLDTFEVLDAIDFAIDFDKKEEASKKKKAKKK